MAFEDFTTDIEGTTYAANTARMLSRDLSPMTDYVVTRVKLTSQPGDLVINEGDVVQIFSHPLPGNWFGKSLAQPSQVVCMHQNDFWCLDPQ